MRSQINHFKHFIQINRDKKFNSRKREICDVDVHRASHVKHFENIKQKELIIPEWLFQEPIEKK